MRSAERVAASPARPLVPARVWLWACAAVPVAILAALGAAALTGASAPTVVGDPGAVVRWLSPAVSVLLRLAQGVVLGGALLLAFVLRAPKDRSDPAAAAWRLARSVLSVAGPAWALLAVTNLVMNYAVISGRPLGGEGFGDELAFYLSQISSGRADVVAAIAAALTALVCVAVSGYGTALFAFISALVALVPVATSGHASGNSNHDLGMTGLYGHIVGAGIWTGGIAVLLIVASRLGTSAPDVARRFSAVAGWCFALVAISGLASAWIRLGSPSALGTRYGAVLLAKILLLGLLGAAGWWHRRVTIAAMDQRPRVFWRLLGVEVALIGVASGLGVALSSSAPPQRQEPVGQLSVTELISTRPAPAAPTSEAILTAFYPDLFFGFLAAAGLVVYLTWVLRLRRRGDRWPVRRTVSWVVAMALLGYLTLGAPAVYGHVMLSVHMAAHMAFVMVLPILLAVCAPVTLALRALPGRRDGSRGPREWLLLLVHSRVGTFIAQPVVAAVLFIGTMVVVYFTPLLLLMATTHIGHLLMILHFVLTGYLFVNGLIGIDPGPRRPGYPMRLVLLFSTMAAHAFFGLAVMNSTELLAADYYGALGLPWGVDALADQHNAGEIAWGIGEIPAVGLAVLVAIAWIRDDERTARRTDRAADRDGDAELTAYNEMLADLRQKSS